MTKKITITKFQNKYRSESTRLQGYDYGSHGYYFVTICTKNRVNYFGEISNFTEIGKIATEFVMNRVSGVNITYHTKMIQDFPLNFYK